ncbi:MAG TPA: hypothetical protein VFF95_14375 [Candidatus Binatus sp.]|nr:hypothetical protein [Candidatus Binatus sp.]
MTVKLLFVFRLVAIAFIAAIASSHALACQCSSGFQGKDAWELAKQETEGATVVFEGTPEHFEVEWHLLNAKVGELVPTENATAGPGDWPRMVVTFRVQRVYKGEIGAEIQVRTGLGGGDCGAVFSPGMTYLVFAIKSEAKVLSVNMCSPGSWVGGSSAQAELRYLRKDRPVGSDLEPIRRWTEKEYATQEERRRRVYEEDAKRYAAVTGEICGTVASEKSKDEGTGIVSFLSTAGFSPAAHPTAYVRSDGSFCSRRLGPGKYYLYFTRESENGLTSAVYYPGVAEKEKATIIEVNAGQAQSGIAFKVPVQETHSVRGVLSIYDSSRVGAHVTYVTLVSLDGGSFRAQYQQRIDFEGSSALPTVKYFKFENVLPGRYTAYVSGLGRGWYTKKEEVSVTTHMKFVSLELFHQK